MYIGRFRTLAALAGLAAALATQGSSSRGAEESCGNHGTAVSFVDSPADAARQAAKEEKLVLVLHVSGHFETPEFT
jgi:hypothetical protein